MLSKNKYEILNGDRTLGYDMRSYLLGLISYFVLSYRATTFYIVPYSPHRFNT